MSNVVPITVSADPVDDPVRWLNELYPALVARERRLRLLEDYYSGKHPLPFLTESHTAKMRLEFSRLLNESKSNFMRLVCDAVEERLLIEGFRLSASSSQEADQDTWAMWQQNDMDSQSSIAILESLIKGQSYLSVWGDGENAEIAIEDACQTIVGYEPGSNYRRRSAALKVWHDDLDNTIRANVYMPRGIYKFVANDGGTGAVKAIVTDTADETTFEGSRTPGGSVRVDVAGAATDAPRWVELENQFVENPLGVVPIIPLRNRPRLGIEGESEISDVITIQNQINAFLFLLALAGYFGAHKQRWATGITIATNAQTGKPEELLSGVDTLWQNENPEGKFGEFSQTDLAGYIKAIEQKVLHIAVTTRTPRHYLIEQGQSPSGDAIKSAESGLVSKVTRKMRPFGEAFEETLRLARRFAGQPESPPDSEVVWADPELRSEAEVVDAAVKKMQIGLIDRWQALEDIGYTQTQIERMRNEPPPVPPAAPTPPPGGGNPEGDNPQ
jgi:hypothetical protein